MKSIIKPNESFIAIDLEGTKVRDISALASCHLQRVNLQQVNLAHTDITDITDISALGSCHNLQRVNLAHTDITDISALVRCFNLQEIILPDNTKLSGDNAKDVVKLAESERLKRLDTKKRKTILSRMR